MREYYTRLLREVRKTVFIFWKAQIAVGLGAGVVTGIGNAMTGLTPWHVASFSIAATVLGYLAMLGTFFIWSVLYAPVRLDRERADEALQKERALQQEQSRVTTLSDALSQKHPRDEHRERMFHEVLGRLEEREIKALKWLYHAGRAGNAFIGASGLTRQGMEALMAKTGSIHLIHVDIEWKGVNHLVERDRFYSTNPNFDLALKNFFYPPPRPMTPERR